MLKVKGNKSVTDLRNSIYEQIDKIGSGEADLNVVKLLNQSINQVLNTYRVQMAGERMYGKNAKDALPGLLD